MTHLVLFSGGISSALTALWLKNTLPKGEELHLLFTDTGIEDIDLYRFLIDCYDFIRPDKFIWLNDGRTPWDVFFEKKFIGNNRVNICSQILKIETGRKYIDDNYPPETTKVYIGLHWSGGERLKKATPHWKPYSLYSPLCDEYWLEGGELKKEWTRLTNIPIPRLYMLKFPHNNCRGFCVQAGLKHFTHLLNTLPDVYKHHEDMEQLFRLETGKDVAILRLRRKDETRPISLKELRERIERGEQSPKGYEDNNGCGCMLVSYIQDETVDLT